MQLFREDNGDVGEVELFKGDKGDVGGKGDVELFSGDGEVEVLWRDLLSRGNEPFVLILEKKFTLINIF